MDKSDLKSKQKIKYLSMLIDRKGLSYRHLHQQGWGWGVSSTVLRSVTPLHGAASRQPHNFLGQRLSSWPFEDASFSVAAQDTRVHQDR